MNWRSGVKQLKVLEFRASMISAIIFDMDGVIVDSEVHWHEVESNFLKGLISEWGSEHQKRILGMSMYDVYAMLVEEYGLEKSPDEFFGYYRGLADNIYGEKVNLIEGAKDVIEQLASSGVVLGLASSSPKDWIEIVLNRFDLKQYFEVVVSAEDVDGRGKPSPDVYLLAANQLGADPKYCLALEDTAKGIQSAKQAGMFCLALRNGFNHDEDVSRADAVIHGFSNVTLERLKELKTRKNGKPFR